MRKKLFEFLVPKPKVNKTKIEKAQSKLDIASEKLKGKTAELNQTIFERANPQFRGKDFTFGKSNKKTKSNTELKEAAKERKKEDKKKNFKKVMKENKKVIAKVFKAPEDFSKGGRAGKMGGGMMGRRFGMKEGKLAVTPREKQLAAQYGDKKRITRGDVITIAKKKGNKNGKTMS